MTITTLQERIKKVNEKIAKKENTISKKTALIEKKRAKMEAETIEQEKRMLEFDISYLEDDIKRLHKEIAETKVTLEKYEKQLAGEMEKEAFFIKEVPEAMKNLEIRLIEEWDRYDIERQKKMFERYKEIGYCQFIKDYSYQAYQDLTKTEEEFHKDNMKDARIFILDLVNRVKDITGEITDWSNIYLEAGNTFPVLNGTVIGKEGRARVESILAGGYNIQWLHIRVLVHSF